MSKIKRVEKIEWTPLIENLIYDWGLDKCGINVERCSIYTKRNTMYIIIPGLITFRLPNIRDIGIDGVVAHIRPVIQTACHIYQQRYYEKLAEKEEDPQGIGKYMVEHAGD